jgi:hypothetical protein
MSKVPWTKSAIFSPLDNQDIHDSYLDCQEEQNSTRGRRSSGHAPFVSAAPGTVREQFFVDEREFVVAVLVQVWRISQSTPMMAMRSVKTIWLQVKPGESLDAERNVRTLPAGAIDETCPGVLLAQFVRACAPLM